MKKHINSLTGLRFVFAVCVFLRHFDMFADLNVEGYQDAICFLGQGFRVSIFSLFCLVL